MLFDSLRFRQHEDSETHILYVPLHFTKLKLDYFFRLPCYLTVHPGCIFQCIITQIKSKRTDGFANQSTRTMFITVLVFLFSEIFPHAHRAKNGHGAIVLRQASTYSCKFVMYDGNRIFYIKKLPFNILLKN